jgi:hypothetical protein
VPVRPEIIDAAFAQPRSFIEVFPAETSPGPRKIFELWDGSGRHWTYNFHWKRPAAEVEAVGCHFMRDAALWAPSVVVQDGGLVRLGNVADEDNYRVVPPFRPDGTFDVPTPHDRVVDRPLLIADGVGHAIWGHWIVDYLPRFAFARDLLGPHIHEFLIPLPVNAPDWTIDLLGFACGIRPEAIIRYNPFAERLIAPRAVLPSYGYSGEYTFHSAVRGFYQGLRPAVTGPRRRICISRAGKLVAGSNRQFPLRDRFEAMASARGYMIVRPETLSLAEQIAVFADASVVIGEHGSGMHNAVFCDPQTVVACIGFWNAIQLQLGLLCGHRNVYLTRGCVWPSEGQPDFRLDVSEADLAALFEQVDRLTG